MHVHFFSPPRSVDFSKMKGLDALRATGGNTGNLLFINALSRQVTHDSATYSYRLDADKLNQTGGLLVIPAANWLGPHEDLSSWYEALKPIKIPMILVGLGAQSTSFDEIPKLKKGTLDFLSLVSERCVSIGVRGQFTADVMSEYGFNNADVVGCPSLYSLCKKEFPQGRTKLGDVPKAVLQATRHALHPGVNHGRGILALEREIFRTSFSREIPYIIQSEREELIVKLDGAEISEALLSYYGTESTTELKNYIDSMKVFFSVDEWFNYLNDFDLVCGTRLHGCVAGLLAGTRSLLVTHDARTLEVAQFAGIPHLPIQTFCEKKLSLPPENMLSELYDDANRTDFENRYKDNYVNYKNFLERNKIGHNLE